MVKEGLSPHSREENPTSFSSSDTPTNVEAGVFPTLAKSQMSHTDFVRGGATVSSVVFGWSRAVIVKNFSFL
jgi:hypothetical protein